MQMDRQADQSRKREMSKARKKQSLTAGTMTDWGTAQSVAARRQACSSEKQLAAQSADERGFVVRNQRTIAK
jgi:hypothetical protein